MCAQQQAVLELFGAISDHVPHWVFTPAVVLMDLNGTFVFYEFSAPPIDAANHLHGRIISETTFDTLSAGLVYLNDLLTKMTPAITLQIDQILSGGMGGGGGGNVGGGNVGGMPDGGWGTGGGDVGGEGGGGGDMGGEVSLSLGGGGGDDGRGGGGGGGGDEASALPAVASDGASLRRGSSRCPLVTLSLEEVAAYDAENAAAVLVRASSFAVAFLQKPGMAGDLGLDSITSVRVSYGGETIVRGVDLW
jgi:hypothetical protein